MAKFKKLICTACAALCCLSISGNVLVNGYKAELCIGEHYRIGSNDFYIQFDVENNKGIAPYCVDILKHNFPPEPYNQDASTCDLCQILLNKCREGKLPQGQILSLEISKPVYIELFNLTKIIKSKKVKDMEAKKKAFNLLVPKVLSLYGILCD